MLFPYSRDPVTTPRETPLAKKGSVSSRRLKVLALGGAVGTVGFAATNPTVPAWLAVLTALYGTLVLVLLYEKRN